MSSIRRHDTRSSHATSIAFAIAAALFLVLALGASPADAKKGKSSATAKKKLPKITKVSPTREVLVGGTLKIQGKNFVKGKKTLIVIFKRDGSKRSFTARGTATSTTRGSVVVPIVTEDLVRPTLTRLVGPLENLFRLRVITKLGAAKEWTGTSISPTVSIKSSTVNPGGAGIAGAIADCDGDGVADSVDADDDNDLLPDVTEAAIGTNVCGTDSDGDIASDFYEYTVAFAYNGGPVLPYPGLLPYPNPLMSDAGISDFDQDGLSTREEYQAWKYTGLMSRFYSDADQDSDGDGKFDAAEDEDRDLLPNNVELEGFADLAWLKTDTDGDGLCDGLDDQDHDGPPTALAVADCAAIVPNNGPDAASEIPALPPTAFEDTFGTGGDPNGALIDGDDNKYSNFYEWYIGGWGPSDAGDAYEPCAPDPYPISPYCGSGVWNPLPTPDP